MSANARVQVPVIFFFVSELTTMAGGAGDAAKRREQMTDQGVTGNRSIIISNRSGPDNGPLIIKDDRVCVSFNVKPCECTCVCVSAYSGNMIDNAGPPYSRRVTIYYVRTDGELMNAITAKYVNVIIRTVLLFVGQ